MAAIYQMFFGWLPAPIQIIVLGFFAYLIILIILKIVNIVLDALPFI